MSSSRDPVDATPQGPSLREAKSALRRAVLAARDALSPDVRAAAGGAIASRIAALPSFVAATRVLLTLSFRSEWDTTPLVRAAQRAGKTVAVPRVDVETRMLALHSIADVERDVRPGHLGIREPLPHCPPLTAEAIDWVLVPGVAFDRDGRRLGYGGGYYDRLLLLVPRTAPRVAGAFDAQIVDRVPATPHDIGVDIIATESRTIEIRR